jgi:HEAT repeat protein
MAVALDDVRRRLDVDEPNYVLLARELGPEAAEHLRAIAAGEDEYLAAKAVYLAGLLPSGSAAILAEAAANPSPVVRVAAAAALANAADADNDSLERLLDDDDPGVRRSAVRSVGRRGSTALRANVQRIERDDPEPALRRQASRVLGELTES